MEATKPSRGGYRQGAGRPAAIKGLSVPISVRVTKEAYVMLSKHDNKSEYIDYLIKKDNI